MTTLRFSAIALAALITSISTASAHDAHRNANRQVSFSVGVHHLDYTEYDDYEMISDGILDSERGAQPIWGFGFGYQGDVAGFENLYARFDVSAARGSTTYNGYLMDFEAGEIIAPHAGKTKNRFWDIEARFGKAFTVAYDPSWQFTPYLSLSKHEWTRNGGYVEYYDHHTAGAGALLQWTNGRAVVGFDFGVGKMIEASMDIPEFDAKFSLGTKSVSSGAISLDLPVGARGHLNTRLGLKSFKYGESAMDIGVIDGVSVPLLEPRSSSKEIALSVGYSFHY